MADPIYLVQGDTGPQIQMTFTRSDTGEAEDMQGATVNLHFRRKNRDTILFTLAGDGDLAIRENGKINFAFESNQLDLNEGEYEGEVEVLFSGGTRETVYDTIDFILRKDFA